MQNGEKKLPIFPLPNAAAVTEEGKGSNFAQFHSPTAAPQPIVLVSVDYWIHPSILKSFKRISFQAWCVD